MAKFKIGDPVQVIDIKPPKHEDDSAAYLRPEDLGAIGIIKEVHVEGASHGTFYVIELKDTDRMFRGRLGSTSYYEQHLTPVRDHIKIKNRV